MKKLISCMALIAAILFPGTAKAVETPARNITVTTTSFINCLSAADSNVQTALNDLDVCLGQGGKPAGSNGQIQYNNNGAFGASANLSYTPGATTGYIGFPYNSGVGPASVQSTAADSSGKVYTASLSSNVIYIYTNPNVNLGTATHLNIGSGGTIPQVIYDPVTNLIYAVLLNTSNAYLYSINPSTLAVNMKASASITNTEQGSFAVPGDGNAYGVIANSSNCTIYKVPVAGGSFTTVNWSGVSQCDAALAYKYSGGTTEAYLFGGSSCTVAKLNTSAMTFTTAAVSGANGFCSETEAFQDIDSTHGNLFIGSEGTNASVATKINSSSLGMTTFPIVSGTTYYMYIDPMGNLFMVSGQNVIEEWLAANTSSTPTAYFTYPYIQSPNKMVYNGTNYFATSFPGGNIYQIPLGQNPNSFLVQAVNQTILGNNDTVGAGMAGTMLIGNDLNLTVSGSNNLGATNNILMGSGCSINSGSEGPSINLCEQGVQLLSATTSGINMFGTNASIDSSGSVTSANNVIAGNNIIATNGVYTGVPGVFTDNLTSQDDYGNYINYQEIDGVESYVKIGDLSNLYGGGFIEVNGGNGSLSDQLNSWSIGQGNLVLGGLISGYNGGASFSDNSGNTFTSITDPGPNAMIFTSGEVDVGNTGNLGESGTANLLIDSLGNITMTNGQNINVFNDGNTLGLIQQSQANPGVQVTSFTANAGADGTSAYISANGTYLSEVVRDGYNNGIYSSVYADNAGNAQLSGGNAGTPTSGGPYVSIGVNGSGGVAGQGNIYAFDLNGKGLASNGAGVIDLNFAPVVSGASATQVLLGNGTLGTYQPALSLIKGTYTNGDLCSYSSSGTLLNCNTAGGAGTVTSVATGTGLTGGTITSTGTIALDLTRANTWSNSTASTSSSTGSATFGGGIGVVGTSYFGTATSTLCGTLQLCTGLAGTGGLGVLNSVAPGSGNGAGIIGISNDGTHGILAGYRLAFFLGAGYNTSGITNSAGMAMWGDGTWSGSSTPSYVTLETTPSGSTTRSQVVKITSTAHIETHGTAPALTSCGTSPSPSIIGNDNSSTVTVGGSATGCTITFASTWTNIPSCSVTNQSLSLTNDMTYTVSATAIVVSQSALSNDKLNIVCQGYN